jgi:transposase
MRPIRCEVERWLKAGQLCGESKTEDVCREILKVCEAWWTFVRDAGVEPTGNAGERAIRPGVLWHKGSFVTQSPQGSRFIDTLMTVVATLKQQHRNHLDYVTAACKAALRGEPAHSCCQVLMTSSGSCMSRSNPSPCPNGYPQHS